MTARRVAVAVAAVLAATALSVAPGAGAVPGDPSPGCVNFGMFNLALVCDGPVRPDGSWQRCSTWSSYYVPGAGGFDGPYGGGGFAPGGRKCQIVSEADSTAGFWGAPPEHIDG